MKSRPFTLIVVILIIALVTVIAIPAFLNKPKSTNSSLMKAIAPPTSTAKNTQAQATSTGGASTPDGEGYWEVAPDGGVFSFGSAVTSTGYAQVAPDGDAFNYGDVVTSTGYKQVAPDGGIFNYGDGGPSPYSGAVQNPTTYPGEGSAVPQTAAQQLATGAKLPAGLRGVSQGSAYGLKKSHIVAIGATAAGVALLGTALGAWKGPGPKTYSPNY